MDERIEFQLRESRLADLEREFDLGESPVL
jgi:hypothetical protein